MILALKLFYTSNYSLVLAHAPTLWRSTCALCASSSNTRCLPSAEPRSTTGLLFPSQYLSGTIWLTPYSMVWDWRVSRAGPMSFCWPGCSLRFCLQLFSLSLLFLYRLVVWGWGLRTDRVSISLSRPCIANLF